MGTRLFSVAISAFSLLAMGLLVSCGVQIREASPSGRQLEAAIQMLPFQQTVAQGQPPYPTIETNEKGWIPGGGGSSGGSDGGQISTVDFRLKRICWVHTPSNDKLGYFEKAQRPILTLQAEPPGNPAPIVLGMVNLTGVDLFQGSYSGSLDLQLSALQQAYPTTWQQIPVVAEVCDDPNGLNECGVTGTKKVSQRLQTMTASTIPQSLIIPVWFGTHIPQDQLNIQHLCDGRDPLVLDLTGKGIRLKGPSQGVSFDLYGTGIPITTGWVASANAAFLARDLNHNGKIDSGAELFGSATILPGGGVAADGFQALSALDSDGDGAITPQDKAWPELVLWIDANFDGVTDPGELKSLSTMGIESISLKTTRLWAVDVEGDETTMRATYLHTLGGKTVASQIFDVWFNVFLP